MSTQRERYVFLVRCLCLRVALFFLRVARADEFMVDDQLHVLWISHSDRLAEIESC